jgi:predicted transposase YbfD/YdcC
MQDPRVQRTRRHKLIDILVISVCTFLCGGETFNDMEDFGKAKEEWFKTFLELPDGIPSHDTFNRLFAALNPETFLDCFLSWTQSLRQTVAQEIVAIDGKALRRALNKDKSIPFVVSAWADSNNLVLGQLKVDDKSNEITAVPELLRALELKGCIVTLDAMGCQKAIAKDIKAAGADYVLSLKGNQGTTLAAVQVFMDKVLDGFEEKCSAGKRIPKKDATIQTTTTNEKGHGRIDVRRYYQSKDLSWFDDLTKWEGLQSVGMVESMREIDGKQTFECRYFLSSLPLDVKNFSRAVRSHWGVENKVHWVMDVCFGEDQSRARMGFAAENLATLRRLSLNMLKKETTKKRGIRGKKLNASWDHPYLLRLLGI